MGVTKIEDGFNSRRTSRKRTADAWEAMSSCGSQESIFVASRRRASNLLHQEIRLFRSGHGKGEHNLRQAILVLGVGALNVRFGLLQSSLAEFHDGAGPKFV